MGAARTSAVVAVVMWGRPEVQKAGGAPAKPYTGGACVHRYF